MIFVTSEIAQRERKFFVGHNPEIGLYAAFQQNTALGLASGQYAIDLFVGKKMVGYPLRLFGGNQQVQVADGLSSTAETAAGGDLRNSRMILEMSE